MSVRTLSLVIGVVALVGCGSSTPNAGADRAFTVSVSRDAVRVSRDAGVELERIVADSAAKVGYTLGYSIVESFLGDGSSAAGAVGVAAKTVVQPYARLARGSHGRGGATDSPRRGRGS